MELRSSLNLLASRQNRPQGMIGVVTRRSADSENGVARGFAYGAASVAHGFRCLLNERINDQLHLHRIEAECELRQPAKSRVGDTKISSLRMADCSQFLFAEQFQRRSARFAQFARGLAGVPISSKTMSSVPPLAYTCASNTLPSPSVTRRLLVRPDGGRAKHSEISPLQSRETSSR